MEPRNEINWLTSKAFCIESLDEGWDDLRTLSEGSFSTPGQRASWRHADPYYDAACAKSERDDDRRLVDAVRQRALAGNDRAMGLCFRTVRGTARPESSKGGPIHEPKPMSPHVAAAMIEAGLKASGIEVPKLGVPTPSDHPNCPPAFAEEARRQQRLARSRGS